MATATTGRPATPVSGPPSPPVRRRGGVWWRVYRHHLRLLRNVSIAWIVALAGVGAGVVGTFEDRLPTEAARRAADALEGMPAFEALFGRYVQPGGLEGFVLSRWGMFALLVAVWGLLAATKLLRGAEEAGHTEPLRAGTLSPRGLLAAAVAALLSWFAIFAVAIGAGHSAVGMDPATAWALGGAMGLLAAAAAAAGALTSQLASSRRRATSLAGIALGVALAVRVLAAASGTPDWVWWATPFGWVGFLHEADGMRPAVLTAFTAVVVVLLAAAFALARRDLGAGVVGAVERSGARVRSVGGQFGLAARTTAVAVLGWGVVLAATAFVFAVLADDFTAVMADMPEAATMVEQMGYTALHTSEGFVALILGMYLAVGVALFAAAQSAAVREEEATWRVEHLLARPVGRVRWLTTRTLAVAVGVVALSLVVAMALSAGTAVGGTAIAVGDAARAGINLIPAALLFLGLGVLLLGLVPRLTAPVAFGLVVGAYLLDFVGPLLELPDAVLDVSPFRHLAAAPVEALDLTAATVMLGIAVLSAAVGIAAFRRRDLKEA